MKITLNQILSQNKNSEYISNPADEKYVTVSGRGNGVKERIIKDGKTPVPFNAYRVKTGQLIYSRIGASEGAFGIVPPELDNAVVSKDFPAFEVDKNKANIEYLLFLLTSDLFCKKVAKESFGATMTRFKEDKLLSTIIDLPSLDTQNTVVDLLNKIKAIIRFQQKELNKLDELVKARFVEMFGKVVDTKFPVVRLGDYAVLQGGFAFKSKDFVEDGIPLVQIGNVNKDYLNWDVVNSVPADFLNRYSNFALSENDLVMAMTRPIIKSLGSVKVAKVSLDDIPCLLNQRVGRFQIKKGLHPIYLETLCKNDDFKEYVEKMSGNSLQPNISSKQVEDYMIMLPPINLQEEFAAFAKRVDKSKVVVQKALDEAQLLFDSLMQKYFG